MKSIKVTKQNFNQFVSNHVKNDLFINLDLPKNELQFKEFTKNIYGVELGISCIAYPFNGKDYKCEYRITGMKETDYSKNQIYKLWEKRFSQYDGLKVLLNSVFGELYCGGVASVHYGQSRCSKEQWDIIMKWDNKNDEKYVEKLVEQHNVLFDIFGANPFLK